MRFRKDSTSVLRRCAGGGSWGADRHSSRSDRWSATTRRSLRLGCLRCRLVGLKGISICPLDSRSVKATPANKSSNGKGRTIPINDDLASVLAAHRAEFIKAFGEPDAAHYLFPWGSPLPTDPIRPVSDLKHGWETLSDRAGVSCRLHDLRHTFATRLAENGVPESTMLALMGHMSRAMLERYSHIRMAAKRDAVAGVVLRPKTEESENSELVPVKVPVVEAATVVQ